MFLTVDDYAPKNIVNIDIDLINNQMDYLEARSEELAMAGYEAETAGDMSLAFAYASDMGVIKIQYGILESEVMLREPDSASEFADLLVRLRKVLEGDPDVK